MFKSLKALIACVLGLVLVFQCYAYGSILFWRAFAPESTSFMRTRALQYSDEPVKYDWVSYGNISNNLKQAVIASEDAAFTNHDGFDWRGIEIAMKRNQRAGEIKAGGSTISQQLAKNLFLWEGKSYVRKAEEAAITLMMEATTDKERIFEIYLNVIEWGPNVFGAEAAAQHHFDKSADKLTKQQAAKLAAMIPRPRYFSENPKDRNLRGKTNIILRRMGASALPESDPMFQIPNLGGLTQPQEEAAPKHHRKTHKE